MKQRYQCHDLAFDGQNQKNGCTSEVAIATIDGKDLGIRGRQVQRSEESSYLGLTGHARAVPRCVDAIISAKQMNSLNAGGWKSETRMKKPPSSRKKTSSNPRSNIGRAFNIEVGELHVTNLCFVNFPTDRIKESSHECYIIVVVHLSTACLPLHQPQSPPR